MTWYRLLALRHIEGNMCHSHTRIQIEHKKKKWKKKKKRYSELAQQSNRLKKSQYHSFIEKKLAGVLHVFWPSLLLTLIQIHYLQHLLINKNNVVPSAFLFFPFKPKISLYISVEFHQMRQTISTQSAFSLLCMSLNPIRIISDFFSSH